MNKEKNTAEMPKESLVATSKPTKDPIEARKPVSEDRNLRQWIVQLTLPPLLLLGTGAVLIFGLGLAQKAGWISAGGGGGGGDSAAAADTRSYICPMLCVPPQIGPGRCPVCEMELVVAASGGEDSDFRSISVDPAARRVANIHTVAVHLVPMERTIRAIGELNYDEGSLKTISAYVDGRLDRLYADYTGAVVTKGDHLALVYSPRLYSGQVELLLAKKAHDESLTSSLKRVTHSNRDMYESTRQRLIELGMTREQIDQLERDGEANSRMHLCAPISGTVIKKYATEGQYVKEGEAIYELADLSTVWLILDLFPEDAATIRYGQKVEAEVQSLPGSKFTGRVAFVDPIVDPVKRTVGVRVVIGNDDGLLRVGDYAKATIQVPLGGGGSKGDIYDSELANKWISPRHPHVVESAPGKCRLCGVDLVPASDFGFTNEPGNAVQALAVPRSAVLMAGRESVLYVETEPGRFEIRNVVLGGRSGEQIVVLKGLEEGEQVAVSGNFLIDSQMQLAGNPSIIDPNKVQPKDKLELEGDSLPPIGSVQMLAVAPITPIESNPVAVDEMDAEQLAAIRELPTDDQPLAIQQKLCPVTDMALGSMGAPVKVMVGGHPVFLCCEGCRKRLMADPEKHLAKIGKEAVQ